MRQLAWIGLIIALSGVACLDYAPPEGAAPIEVLEVRPSTPGSKDPVALRFSSALLSAPLELRDSEAAVVPCDVEIAGPQVVLRPRPAWPAGARLDVVAIGALEASGGLTREAPTEALASFLVADSPSESQPYRLVGPFEGPANLRWLLIAGPVDGLQTAGPIALGGYGPPRVGTVRAIGEGRALVEVDVEVEECNGDCESRRFSVLAMEANGALGQIHTSSSADRLPPHIEWVETQVRGDGVQLRVFASEPVVVQGRLLTEGTAVDLPPPERLSDDVIVGVRGLDPSTRYRILLDVRDVAGNPGEVPPLEVLTADVPVVEISELVVAPLRDWSDSDGSGVPFDPWPGLGAVTDNDEWVEIVNRSDREVDLLHSGLELRALDTSPSVTPVDAAPGLYFGAGGSRRAWRPGEALVVRPRGALSQRSLRLEVWGAGVLLDSVVVGSGEGAVHPGGAPLDAVHEAIARDSAGAWRWCAPTPGTPGPNPDCR